ncbi:hypothetical protein OE88DRAFT_1656797 [Heliocybe sulcata]|uniref:Uncharacterized protein n=1 Tax=Heliocybe sulcata TaxID=5364 RepID=A0A5C3N7I2_9AGAM|nr:hypothetical protein OE88DRAFT_1656797 [Heliocybe sulcata]
MKRLSIIRPNRTEVGTGVCLIFKAPDGVREASAGHNTSQSDTDLSYKTRNWTDICHPELSGWFSEVVAHIKPGNAVDIRSCSLQSAPPA